MLPILFGERAISSRRHVLANFIPGGDGHVVKLLMMLLVNVTFFGWHRFSFSPLLLALFESDDGIRQSSLIMSVFSDNTVVAPLTTSIALSCGFSVSKLSLGHDSVKIQCTGSSTRPVT